MVSQDAARNNRRDCAACRCSVAHDGFGAFSEGGGGIQKVCSIPATDIVSSRRAGSLQAVEMAD
jgi:hypothetical protein